MAITVYESTRFEVLWEQFEETLRAPLKSPLELETIAVPARGWETFFSRRLAASRGCWAGYRFLPTGLWIGETLQNVLGESRAPRREPDSLTWIIAARLSRLLDDEDFAPVRGYLYRGGGRDPQRLIDLSRCIGGLFDRYLLFRPDLIAAWKRGVDWSEDAAATPASATWQRKLWQEIASERRFRSVAAMIGDLPDAIADSEVRLPERVSVWISGGVAPAQLAFLEAMGSSCSINVFVVCPATEYWGDMHGRKRLLRKLRDSGTSLGKFCRENHLDLMHPLLASMAEPSRQQQMLMVDCDGEPWRFQEMYEGDEVETLEPRRQLRLFEEDDDSAESELAIDLQSPRLRQTARPAECAPTLLSELQSDIRSAGEPFPRRLPRDGSVRIHSCHSAIREVEVLQDRIREALEDEPDLTPDDICVLCPQLDEFSPLVQAVFGLTKIGEPGHIPFSIVGRSSRSTQPVIGAWLQLVEILSGRFPAGEILDLLELDPVSDRAGLDAKDRESVIDWVADADIRWGADAEHRHAEELPATDLNTWQFGLDRLLLGFAMPPGGGELVGDVVTIDRAEGLAAETIGRLWSFIDRLKSWRERIEKPRSPADWRGVLGRLAIDMLDTAGDEAGTNHLLDALDQVASLSAGGGFTEPVSIEVIVREVERIFDENAGSAAYRGGVMFCSFDAVRSLPFEVVCLMGMNDGVVPRSDRSVSFDLMAHTPRIGDHRPRDDDRQLFLDAILAAGRRLIITCQGQDVRDQRTKPPSVLVLELLDVFSTVERAVSGAKPIQEHVFVRHPLQAFSPRCFDGADSRVASFMAANLRAAEKLTGERQQPRVFVEHALEPALDGDDEEVHIEELYTFLDRSWKLFLRRLDLRTLEVDAQIDDREPALLDGLDQWQLGTDWLNGLLNRADLQRLQRLASRAGTVPAGTLGELVLTELGSEAAAVIDAMRAATDEIVVRKLPVDVTLDGMRLTGHVDHWSERGLRQITFSKPRAKQKIRQWLDQIISTVATGAEVEAAVLAGRGGKLSRVKTVDVETAASSLTELMRLCRAARNSPLVFFADDGVLKPLQSGPRKQTEAVKFDDPASVERYVQRVRTSFQGGSRYSDPLAQDADVRSAFAGRDPFQLTCSDVPEFADCGDRNLFAHLVERICSPMLDFI